MVVPLVQAHVPGARCQGPGARGQVPAREGGMAPSGVSSTGAVAAQGEVPELRPPTGHQARQRDKLQKHPVLDWSRQEGRLGTGGSRRRD